MADGVLPALEPEAKWQQLATADQPVAFEARMGQDLDHDFRFLDSSIAHLEALSWRELGHSQPMGGVSQVLDAGHWRLAGRVRYEMNRNISNTSGMNAFGPSLAR